MLTRPSVRPEKYNNNNKVNNMKSYEEFTNNDLKQFLAEKGFIRQNKRVADEREVIDYEKLSNLLGCKPRQARNLVDGKQQRFGINSTLLRKLCIQGSGCDG